MRKIRTQGLAVLGMVTVGFFLGACAFSSTVGRLTPALVLWAGLQSLASFTALLWALPRSNRAFFTIFTCDALLRFAVLGAVTVWLFTHQQPYTGPLLSLGLVTPLLLWLEIPFLSRVR